MVDWNSPETLQAEGVAISKIDLVMLGMYVWECIASSKFDYEVLTRKRRFKTPILVYFWSKYFTLWFIISINIMLQTTTPVNCMAMSTFIDFSGRTAIAASSNLLLLRSLALWKFDPRVVWPMVLASFGQWAVLLHNMFITKEVWSTAQQTCVIVSVGDDWTKIQFIYTMCFDFVVLCLALTALLKLPGVSSLWRMLFFDGLAYFCIAFICYLAATIMAVLNLNGVSMFMVSDPATIIANTAATRSFVRVLTYQENIITLPSSDIGTTSSGNYRPFVPPWQKPWLRRGSSLPPLSAQVPQADNDQQVQSHAIQVNMETYSNASYPPPGFPDTDTEQEHKRHPYAYDYSENRNSSVDKLPAPSPSEISSPYIPSAPTVPAPVPVPLPTAPYGHHGRRVLVTHSSPR